MKRGQASSAAALLALLGVFILLYLLVIPPDYRNELLGDSPGSNGKTPSSDKPGKLTYNQTVFTGNPGRLDYQKFKAYDHPLPSVNLYSTTRSSQSNIGESVFVKNGIMEKKSANLTFRVPDNARDAVLSFSINPNRNSNGVLTVRLNGDIIFSRQASGTINPMQISNLQSQNNLDFEVSGVGYRFWTTNEYEVQDINLAYDTVDESTQKSKNTFMVTESEKFNLEKATLTFYPDCSARNVGRLHVLLNSEEVFSAVPDCGYVNRIELSPGNFDVGMNRISFEAEEGNYLIDQINVHTELESLIYPTYYFDLDTQFFTDVTKPSDDESDCGSIDGFCPSNCDPDLDKDCCFEETSSYWCDSQPDNSDNRCSAVNGKTACGLCSSGYEDDRGNPPDECEDMCGDDTDNECPDGCSKFEDMDCCYEDDPDNFWCADQPRFGLSTCRDIITNDDCDGCASGWESEDNNFKCETDENTESKLKSQYHVTITLLFADATERKAGKVYVNGYQFNFITYGDEYKRTIDRYVEEDANSIKIEPDSTALEIRKLLVEVKE
jgi:hypothetical protein